MLNILEYDKLSFDLFAKFLYDFHENKTFISYNKSFMQYKQ